ncbi:PAS domain S-box protein [Ancylomarina sp. M3P]|nr:PAS domain S-box protein [Ancylomarina euxinus]
MCNLFLISGFSKLRRSRLLCPLILQQLGLTKGSYPMKYQHYLFLFLCLLFLTNPTWARKKKILVLHSYHQGLNWTDNITRGMQSIFEQHDNLEVQFEYMDSKRNSDPAYLVEFAKLYELKHHNIPFEVIIASDNNALEFARKYQNTYFKDIPVVFASIDQFDESLIEGMTNVTGVTEFIDFKRTIQEALRLHPKAKNLVVINDNQTTSAIINRNHIKSFWPDIKTDVNLVFLENLSIDELVDKVNQLDDSNIILLLNFSKDKEGNYISYQENIEIIREATQLPIYSSWVFYLGEGIVGGMLTSGFEQGKLAAQIALRVINGEDINQIPLVTSGYNSLIFDYNQMQRFDISPDQLPEGSQIIHLPLTLFEKYKTYLLLISVFLILICIIIFYSRYIRKRNENRLLAINKDLKVNRTRLLRMLDSNSDGVWEHNFKSERLTFSKQIWLNLGYDPDRVKNTLEFVYAHIHPDDQAKVEGKRLDCLKEITETFEVVFRICNANQEWKWYKGKGKILDRDDANAPTNMVGTLTDITERKLAEEQIQEDEKQIRASEKRWRSLIELAADEILIHNFSGKIIDANSSACQSLGYSHKDLLEMNYADLDSKYSAQNLVDYWNKLSPDKSSINMESIQKRHDGSTFPVEINLSLIDLEEDQLILAVVRDISKRQETERKVLNAVIETEENERRRFAKDLHDSIGPLLSSINLYLSALKQTDEAEKKQSIIKVSREAVNEALVSIKEISNNLSPHILSDFGLEKAINSFTQKLQVSERINISFHAENLNERLNEQVEVVIYRVVTELIHNTIKHAKAENIEINLSREKDELKLIYIDDGIGFDTRKLESDKTNGMGLYNILSRVRSLNGTHKIKSNLVNGGMMAVLSVKLESGAK